MNLPRNIQITSFFFFLLSPFKNTLSDVEEVGLCFGPTVNGKHARTQVEYVLNGATNSWWAYEYAKNINEFRGEFCVDVWSKHARYSSAM